MLNSFASLSLSGQQAASGTIVMQDITSEYFAACDQALDIGELIRNDDFSLQDAIAALEIMDPKMDNGVIDPIDAGRPAYRCSTALPATEMLAIMDQLCASEMTWHSGSSLSQTLYTCIYVQKVLGKTLQVTQYSDSETGSAEAIGLLDKVLFPYVVATIKACDIVREEYLTGYLYEEEDVSTADFGLELLPFVPSLEVSAMLQDGIDWLEDQSSTSSTTSSELSQLSTRLQLRLQFLELMQKLDDPEQWALVVPRILVCLDNIKISTAKISDYEDIFNTSIQRTLISTSPPRPMISNSVVEAYAELRRASTDLLRLIPVTTSARDSPATMLSFFEVIRKNRPPMLALVRSRLQNLFLEDKLAQHASNKQNYLIRAIEEVCGPRPDLFDPRNGRVEQPRDKRFAINKIVSDVLARLEPPFLDYYKILCHNSGRQRRNLCKILADFDVLQAEAEVADQELATLVNETPKQLSNGHVSLSFTISSWVFNTKLDISLAILFMGFETDLYRPFEWSMIYWHLDNLLFLQNEHLYSIVIDRLPNYSPTRAHLAHRILLNEATGLLCKAYLRLTNAAEFLGVSKRPQLKFSSEASLYHHRMTPFAKLISPPAVSYETYVSELPSRTGTQEGDGRVAIALLHDASDHFNAARMKFGTLLKRGASQIHSEVACVVEDFQSEVKGLVGCCIGNNLMVSRLLKQEPGWFKGKQLKWGESKFSRRFPDISIE